MELYKKILKHCCFAVLLGATNLYLSTNASAHCGHCKGDNPKHGNSDPQNSDTNSGTTKQRVFSESDNGRTVSLHPGETITLRLKENRTTGYQWSGPEFSGSGLKLASAKYLPPRVQLVGAGGEREFTFKATSTGEGKLNLQYERSWMKGKEKAGKTFELSYKVG